jgi:catechol 2,3-dioxygenase-like lactoylglutathione lyase family enzyme
MIQEIAFTGTSVTDMKRARAFYEDTLGLQPSEEIAGGKWIEYHIGNGTFAITNINPKWTPSDQVPQWDLKWMISRKRMLS